jgi:DUF1680 family protein
MKSGCEFKQGWRGAVSRIATACVAGACFLTASAAPGGPVAGEVGKPALFGLEDVRLLKSPFTAAVEANRAYLLKLELDRLLAPFRREAGLEPRKPAYGNWESGGLDGHTAGHYLSALASMMASGNDTAERELGRRLDYMVDELSRCQQACGNGYVGGVPGSKALWKEVEQGHIEALNGKWVPWYNVHKTLAGLRDAYSMAGNEQALEVMVRLGDWCDQTTRGLSDEQMQRMLGTEHGGMNEVLADLYAIRGDEKYLSLARRFCHAKVLNPLKARVDGLTGLHANTQIPKVVGLERIGLLTGNKQDCGGARFFWENVTGSRSVAFGGNSVSEHFNNPADFGVMIEHREGPETCNTYNMLRLTELLFTEEARAEYADFYERALYNHILASINPANPGFVYFTPIRPQHYRVYSQPEQCFWCCVGTGMENPGKYGKFIYARATNGVRVNLFIPSVLSVPELGLGLRQETAFPDEARTRLTMHLARPETFSVYVRHPSWVSETGFALRVNGQPVSATSSPSSYVEVRRKWRDGDLMEVELPMRTTVERLPDGSDWVAILRGPIVLASPCGTNGLTGLRANDTRMGHVASGPLVPLDQVPVLLASADELPAHVTPDDSGSLRFRLKDIVEPAASAGLPLIPFFRLHDQRYQMYWQLTTQAGLLARQERLASEERAKAAREAATLDWVAVGEQQSEVEHAFRGEAVETGEFQGRRWRHGHAFQYSLDCRGSQAVELAVTYSGGDRGRVFDVFAGDKLLATERLTGGQPGRFFERRYRIPSEAVQALDKGLLAIRFVGREASLAGGVFDVRLMRIEEAGKVP